MNKDLKAEIWEVQVILFLILATQVPWQWAKVTLIVWSVLTFIGIIVLKTKVAIEIKNAES